MLRQIEALLLLKLSMAKNAWMRGQVLSAIAGVATIAGCLLLALLIGAVCVFLGYSLPDGGRSPRVPLLGGDAIVAVYLFIVVFGVLVKDLQSGDVVDFRKMLYLPISLKTVFIMNMVSALATPSAFVFSFSMSCFVAGLSLSLGPRMIGGLALLAAFLWMMGSWLYFFKSWLLILLESKRRRRVVAAVAIGVVAILGQLPSLLNFAFRGQPGSHSSFNPGSWLASLDAINAAIPFGWLPLGLQQLATGSALLAMTLCAGMAILGFLGVSLGYKATLRFHSGGGSKGVVAEGRKEAPPGSKPKTPLTLRTLPFLGEELSAVALASFLSFARHPHLRMQFLSSSIIMAVAFLPLFLTSYAGGKSPDGSGSEHLRHFVAFGAAILPYFGMFLPIHNMFGVDMAGFKSYILSPLDRRTILLGKNLASLPFVLGFTLACLLLGFAFLGVGPFDLAMALLAAFQIFLIQASLGNYVSQLCAYPCRFDEAFKPSKKTNKQMFSGFIAFFCMPLSVLPAASCFASGYLLSAVFGGAWLYAALPLSLLLLAVLALLYWLSLESAGKMLMRREVKILAALSAN